MCITKYVSRKFNQCRSRFQLTGRGASPHCDQIITRCLLRPATQQTMRRSRLRHARCERHKAAFNCAARQSTPFTASLQSRRNVTVLTDSTVATLRSNPRSIVLPLVTQNANHEARLSDNTSQHNTAYASHATFAPSETQATHNEILTRLRHVFDRRTR